MFALAVSTVNINSSTLDLLFGLLVSSLVLGFFLLVQPMLTQVHKEVFALLYWTGVGEGSTIQRSFFFGNPSHGAGAGHAKDAAPHSTASGQ